MRGTFVTILAVGGLLTLGAWTTPGQSTESGQAGPVEPSQVAGQPAGEVCASAQARDVGVRRTHTRPRASSARPSVDSDCSPSLIMVRRDSHRAHRNAAIDRSLRGD